MSQAKHLASHLSGYGRYGDSMLMHVNPDEVRALDMMAGIAGRHLTTNPDTGLPEAFNLFDILPFAINLIAPGMGTAAQVALGAVSGAASGAVEGEDPLARALTGGVMGGISSNMFGGAAPAQTALEASTAAANQAAGQAVGQAAGQAAGQTAGQAVGQAAMDGIERAAIPANPDAYLTDVFGKGSDEFVGNLFSGSNMPLTIAGASYLGSMLPGQEYEEEKEESGPKGEWRPGEGYVPFQQAGVRSFNPAEVSPTGVEQNWINYGPSADPSTYRRFADGGPVSVENQLAAIRAGSGARPMTTPVQEGKGGFRGGRGPISKKNYFSYRAKGGLPGQTAPQQAALQQAAPRQPAVVTPEDPMRLVQGGQGGAAPVFAPALYNPVGAGQDAMVRAYRKMMDQSGPQINPGSGGGETALSVAKHGTYDDATLAQMRNDRIAALGGMNQGGTVGAGASGGKGGLPGSNGRPSWYGTDFTPAEGSGKGGLPGQSAQGMTAPAEQRNNPMQMPASAAPQAGNNDMQEQAMRNGGYVRRYADGGQVKEFNPMGMVGGVLPMIVDGFTDGNKFGSGLLGMMLNKRKPWETFMPAPEGPQGPQSPGMRNGGYVRRYADGGPVMGGIAQGLEIPPMQQPAPMGVPMNAPMPQGAPQVDDETLVRAAAAAISGQIPGGESIIQLFVAKFGEQALQQLIAMVNPQVPENMGRLLKGPGDGRSDSIPAAIDGVAPAKLSTGEFVVPAKAVSKLGRGSTEAGAQKLQSMVNKVNRKSFEKAPEVIDDMEPMRI